MRIAGPPRRARLAVAAVAGVAAAVTLGTPATAHVELQADKPQAGAREVTITFTGESESSRAGIKSERVVLPPGIRPDEVRLARAPFGWEFSRNPDGFTVAGPTLRVGQDSVFAVTVSQLPSDATELPFKTLETYGDGRVDRWIEIPQPGQPEPPNPAPVLKVKPAAATPAGPSPTPSTTAADPGSAAPTQRSTTRDTTLGNAVWIALIAVALVAAVIIASVGWRRRWRR